jgi:hypothetical protein
MDNLETGKSFQKLATLFLIAGGFMLVGAWTFYNAFQNNPDLPKILNHLVWLTIGTIFIILSFFIWFVGHQLIIGKILTKNTELENMLMLLKDMAKGSPSWYYPLDHLKKFILTDDGINNLVKMGVISHNLKKNPQKPYSILPKGIQLISAWESVKYNSKLNKLTIILIILGLLNLIFLVLF